MPFAPFFSLFPDLAERETRTITVLPGSKLGLPRGEYEFVEMFCDEAGCDCRRVFFTVLTSERKHEVAVIAWGWEDADFYARWLGVNEPELVKEMQGPVLNLGSSQTTYSGAILEVAENFLLSDPAYVERIKRHYAMWRERIDGRERGTSRMQEWGPSIPKDKRKKWKWLKMKHRTG